MMTGSAALLLLGLGCGPSDPPGTVSAAPRTGLPGPSAPAAERLRRGAELEAADRLAEAAAEFRSVLAQDGTNVDALTGLGRVASRMGDASSALAFLRRAVELRPRDGSLRNHHAALLAMSGRREEAEAEFTRAAALAPDDPQIPLNAALNLADLGRWDEARARARRAAELLPKDPTPWMVLGRLEARQGRPLQALPHFEKAGELGPEVELVQYHLAKARLAAGQKAGAEAPLRKVLAGKVSAEIRAEAEALLAGLR